VLAVRRWRGDDERLLLVNFGDTPFETEEFGSDWSVLLASKPGSSLRVAPRSAVILARGSA
jgi:Domain of unknown function (DUF3459)